MIDDIIGRCLCINCSFFDVKRGCIVNPGDDMSGLWLRRIMKILAFVVLYGIIILMALGIILETSAYEYVQPAGWVENAKVKAAMDKMGPRYNYKMVGESRLYVDTVSGAK